MQFLLEKIIDTLSAGKPFVLATVVRSEGSSPRSAGACMLIDADGAQQGTIGGGAVEFAAAKHAAELVGTDRSETQLYRLNKNEVADLGMICGGRVWVLFEAFAADERTNALFSRLMEAKRAGRQGYLVRSVRDGAVVETGVFDDGALHFAARIDPEAVRRQLGARAVITGENEQLLTEPVNRVERVYLFGGGHVSQKLVPVLAYVDFRVTVLEDRAEFADKALFPAAEDARLCDFGNVAEAVTIAADDYAVIMTRGHMSDYELLRQALRTEATYIGCIGSRHKVALTRQKLLADGFAEADLARIHSPIGLAISAETPEEIAISIAGEMIQHRAKR